MCVKVHIEKRFLTHFSFDIFRFWLSGNMLPGRGERAGVGGRGSGRVLGSYMAYTGMCCWTGMVFVLSVLGYIITRGSDLNRVYKGRTISYRSFWWSVIDCFEDVDDKLNGFNLLFNPILDDHAPIKKIKLRSRPNPCVTDEIRSLIRTKDYWRKMARKSNDPPD